MTGKALLGICVALGVSAIVPLAGTRPKVSLVRVPNGGIQPVAVEAGNTLHLLYFSGDPKAGDLYYVTSRTEGANWSAPLRVNSVPGTAIAVGTIRGGEMAIGRNGRVHVAWNGSGPSTASGPMNPESGQRGAPMLYSRLNDAGTGFEPERNLMTHTFGLDGGGTVAADNAGNVYAAWHGKAPGAREGEAGRQVWVAISRDDGQTFAAEKPAWGYPTGACGCCGMAMFADSKGVVRALYRSATDNVHRDIYELESDNQGRSFQGRKLHTWNINACPMSSMAFAESGGAVYGAWETSGQVYFEQVNGPAIVDQAPGAGPGRKHPRIAVGGDGSVMLVWTEGTGWQKGGSLAWQEYDSAGKAIGDSGHAAGVPTWSFGAVVASPGGFVILY